MGDDLAWDTGPGQFVSRRDTIHIGKRAHVLSADTRDLDQESAPVAVPELLSGTARQKVSTMSYRTVGVIPRAEAQRTESWYYSHATLTLECTPATVAVPELRPGPE